MNILPELLWTRTSFTVPTLPPCSPPLLLPPFSAACSCPPPTVGPIFNLELPHTRRTVWSRCIVCVTNRHMHKKTHKRPPTCPPPTLPTDTLHHTRAPCYPDFSTAPWPAGNSSQLSQYHSSLTLWLSKHQGWTLLFLFFLSLFSFNWCG